MISLSLRSIRFLFFGNMGKYLFFLFVWSSTFCLAQTVYKTPSGEKYHTSTCRFVKNVSHAISISEAKGKGLSPCSQCNPNASSTYKASSSSSSGLGIKPGEAQGKNTYATQCKGWTKKKTRCKNPTKNKNGYCHHHEP